MIQKMPIFPSLAGICVLWVAGFWLGLGTTSAQVNPELVARGEEVYKEKKCHACHVIRGEGGKIGGDLTHVGAERDAEWLNKFMKDPKSIDPKSKMPRFRGTKEELEAVVAYMGTLI